MSGAARPGPHEREQATPNRSGTCPATGHTEVARRLYKDPEEGR